MQDLKWIAVYTKANQEKVAIDNIDRQGYTSYCPTFVKTRKSARKIEKVRRPLFPSYVFVQLDVAKTQWRPLLSTRGCITVVHFNERLGYLPNRFIEDLRSLDDDGHLQQLGLPQVSPGMKVRITEGVFKDQIAEVMSLPDKDRVWLLMELMGQKVPVKHELADLRKAS